MMNIENALARYMGYSKNIKLVDRDITLKEGNFINAIIGPRRAGKTSLMLLYMKKLETEEKNKIFINCEDIDFIGITTNDLDNLEAAIYKIYRPTETKKIYLFIDEVQIFPNWSRWLRTLFDQHKYQIFVSGSTSDLSLDKLPSELRGRAVNTLVLPFSFQEFLNTKKINHTKYPNVSESGRLTAALSEFLDFGGYPEIVKTEDVQLKQTMLSELYATVIRRDLIERYSIRKTAVFKAFMNSLFGSACRNVSLPAITSWFASQNIKVSNQTALNYLNYAQSAFLFFLIYPYSKKIKERNTKPKLYVSDSGILSLFDADKSKKLENTILTELMRRHTNVYYYKTASEDIDFVTLSADGVFELIQVSYSITNSVTYKREMSSLLAAADKLKCSRLTVITFNEEKSILFGKKTVRVVPAWKWLLSA